MFSSVYIKGYLAHDHGEDVPTHELVHTTEPTPMRDAELEPAMDKIAKLCEKHGPCDWVSVVACDGYDDYPIVQIDYGRTHHGKDHWYGADLENLEIGELK